MIKITGYHATTKKSCNIIISSGVWNPSIGIRHWLGNGVYFFESLDDTKDWATKYGDKAAIIQAMISVKEDKFFDLDNKSHLEVFKERAKEILDNINQHDIIIDNRNKIDGYVLNFIYDNFYQFDVVKRKFYFHLKDFDQYKAKYNTSFISRLMEEQIQYCVRQNTCIIGMKEMDIA